jgi:hypothetical protein
LCDHKKKLALKMSSKRRLCIDADGKIQCIDKGKFCEIGKNLKTKCVDVFHPRNANDPKRGWPKNADAKYKELDGEYLVSPYGISGYGPEVEKTHDFITQNNKRFPPVDTIIVGGKLNPPER